MARWQDIVDSEPGFATEVRSRFDAHKHKTMATLRADGSPRISGIEVTFSDGDIWIGSMAGARKAADLRRDPRLALHCASEDPPEDPTAWTGDAKLSGRAELIDDPQRLASMGGDGDGSGDLFRIDVTEAVLTRVGTPPDHLVIETWVKGRGLSRVERR
ncbi:MAG TPA: pyridoxamine 5'-phosphate oxidase family protein [Dehalococcoidia bacterium]|nr:pyridoxamine 5'-phosphate oxidase family protein [Dehalococcoidia bacterium]